MLSSLVNWIHSDVVYWIQSILPLSLDLPVAVKSPSIGFLEKYDSRSHAKEIKTVSRHFLSQCKIPYIVTPYNHDFHSACCRTAYSRGYPMEGKPGLGPFIAGGVVMATTSYAHLSSEPTRIFIALYTAFLIYLDDVFQHDIERVNVFNERFIMRQPQADPVLDSFAELLRETPQHFGRVVANIMITSTLNLVTALLLEYETQDMPLSSHAHGFPTFSRVMSGASETYALFAFPPELPLQSYIQALPELMMFINNGNDILSFYKEDLAGESVNRISNLAKCHGASKIEVLRGLSDSAVACHYQVSRILTPHREAHDAYMKFAHGYIRFHTSLPRYRLRELFSPLSQ